MDQWANMFVVKFITWLTWSCFTNTPCFKLVDWWCCRKTIHWTQHMLFLDQPFEVVGSSSWRVLYRKLTTCPPCSLFFFYKLFVWTCLKLCLYCFFTTGFNFAGTQPLNWFPASHMDSNVWSMMFVICWNELQSISQGKVIRRLIDLLA